MTYEEKLGLIVTKLTEAKKRTRGRLLRISMKKNEKSSGLSKKRLIKRWLS